MSTIGFWFLVADAFQLALGCGSSPAAAPHAAGQLPDTVRIVRTAPQEGADAAPCYTVQCKVVANQGMTISIPTVTLGDGEKVNVSDTSEKTFIVAVRSEKGVDVPVHEKITEGSTAEIVVRSLGEDRLLLDISFEARCTNSHPKSVPQPVRIHVCSGRAIESGRLGQRITTNFATEGWRIEAVVNRAAK